MKKLFLALAAMAMVLSGCQKFEDKIDQVNNRVDNLEERVLTLEELCNQMNTNISSLQIIVAALQNNDYVQSIVPLTENGKEVGYTITFTKSGAVTIYHGKDGANGANGNDGQNGTNGVDGKDGHTPQIGVKQDTDGIYYWTVDGEWLLDDNGNKIKAVGKDGQDGANGNDGQDGVDGTNGTNGTDGITPELKIEGGYWYVSYDEGATWKQLGKATGENGQDGADGTNGTDGKDGKDGADGKDGVDGKDGDSFFQSVDTSNSDYVILTLADGTEIKLPTWYAFEQLQKLCNQMNTNISSLQVIVAALQNNDYVQSIVPLMDNGKEVGYTITFTKSGTVNIYHGKDGKDGANGSNGTDGKDGQDGANGANGKDGHTPVIGVKQHTDGIYYWTIDGAWLLDNDGNKVKAVGTDGKDGQDGTNGNDGTTGPQGPQGEQGVTPQLKIENGYWYVSYDNGSSWKQLGKATGEDGKDGQDGDSFFQSVTEDENNVYIILMDGTTFTLPKVSSHLFNRIQTISYIPRYSDGKATVVYTEKSNSYVELDFKVTPAEAAANLQSISSVEAVYTKTRASVNFVDMEIMAWSVDAKRGIITVRASGKNLNDAFYAGTQEASVCLTIAGEGVSVESDFIPMTTKKFVVTDFVLEASFKASAEQEKYFPNNIALNNKIVMIDYGDGTFSDELSHTYAETGNYAIKFYFENPITSIKQNAFSHFSVTSICIPKSVTSIEKYAFYNATSLESVKFADDNQLYQIGDFAFGNTQIKEITIPKNVASIGEAVFVGSKNLEKICVQVGNKDYISWDMNGYDNILSTLDGENIIAYASGSTMQELRVMSNPVTIKTNSFSYCKNIISIYMPIKEIEPYNFYIGCNALSTLNLAETAKIGNSVLNNCPNLCVIEAPKVSEIGQNCFNNNSSMTEINLGCDELSVINYIGNDNAKLRNISLPNGVTTISDSFNNCASIEVIYIRAINPPTLTNSFNAITDGAKIYIPAESLDAYKTADGWKDFADSIVGYDF